MEKEFSATLLFLPLKNERDSCTFFMTGHSHSRYVQKNKTCFVQVSTKDNMRVAEAGKVAPASTQACIEAGRPPDTAHREVHTRAYVYTLSVITQSCMLFSMC